MSRLLSSCGAPTARWASEHGRGERHGGGAAAPGSARKVGASKVCWEPKGEAAETSSCLTPHRSPAARSHRSGGHHRAARRRPGRRLRCGAARALEAPPRALAHAALAALQADLNEEAAWKKRKDESKSAGIATGSGDEWCGPRARSACRPAAPGGSRLVKPCSLRLTPVGRARPAGSGRSTGVRSRRTLSSEAARAPLKM